ncbi:MAG: hypothetical protein V4578_11750, partial [Pseudomonadota bacterium]
MAAGRGGAWPGEAIAGALRRKAEQREAEKWQAEQRQAEQRQAEEREAGAVATIALPRWMELQGAQGLQHGLQDGLAQLGA